MRLLKIFITVFGVLILTKNYAQDKRKFRVHTVAFYNVENLFDTINDPNKFDEASPIMELDFDPYTAYTKKVKNMARVISEIGADVSKNTPAIIGLC
ncbi:MAG: endonuclease/exonuclease/phosphatase family protein, partial [Flavobacteriaceae bacterium]|nr:endonuclease/exonuclease/phosphatase family protein [Flavobacteriaceae bacterium]